MGTVLNTASDPKLAKVVDTTQVAGPHLAGLTVNFAPPILLVPNTDGTFAFNTTGLTNFFIGFQLNDKNIFHQPGDIVNPDWFVFNLAGILTGSGTFYG